MTSTFPTIRDLQYDAWKTAEEKGFHDQEVSPLERLALIASEVGEAVECCRDGSNLRFFHFDDNGKPLGLPSELADIVIRVFDLAAVEGIDLEQAILAKMAYNRTRPHMHGKTI